MKKEIKIKNKNKNSNFVFKKKIKEQSIAIVFFAVVTIVLINSILLYTRIDLTKSKIYSISKVSQEIIKDIKNPVYIDYYLTPSLKITNEQPQQIIDLLQEYSARSRGKVIFTIKDASKEEVKPELEKYAIEQKQVQTVEKEQASFAIVYTGLVISYQDRFRVMPFVIEPAVVEYQVTSKILEVYSDDDRILGILTLDDSIDPQQDLAVIQQVLSADYKIEKIQRGLYIDDKIDALIVLGSKDLDNDTAYYLDQFIMTGKGVFFAADKGNVDLTQGITINVVDNKLLFDMLENYGVEVRSALVADELNKFIPLSQGRGFQTLQPYAMWITIDQRNINLEHPITSSFAGMDLYWTSPLFPSKPASDIFTSIINTSDKAWTIAPTTGPPSQDADGSDPNIPREVFIALPAPDNFLSQRNSNNEQSYTISAAILGSIPSAVESQIITKPSNVEKEYKSKVTQGRLVITGSYLFLTRIYQATNAGYNFSFLSNATEWLSSNEQLLKIKSRIVQNTQLNKIQSETKKEALILFVKIFNIGFIPLLIIVIAMLVLIYRRNLSKKRY